MRKLYYFTLGAAVLLMATSLYGQEAENPEPAFPDLVDYENIRDFTLTNSGNECYTSLQGPSNEVSVIVGMKKVNNSWSKPFMVSFSGTYMDLEPFLSPDNLRLYFASNRPLTATDRESKDYDIWYVSRETLSSPWGEPINMGAPVNSEKNEFYPSLAENGNLYFTSDLMSSKGKDDIFLCEWQGDHYKEPVSLNESINTQGYEFNAYISPDESFLIFTGYNRQDGYGSGDMYISYREEGQPWQKAVNMGTSINSNKMDYCPFVDLRNNTLYFTSKRASEKHRKGFDDIDDLLKTLGSYENGSSRIYKASLKKKPESN
jgi:hypothetical protein